MKKILSAVMLLLVFTLCGCGNTDSHSGAEEVTSTDSYTVDIKAQAVTLNDADWYMNQDFQAVISELESAGFTEIQQEPIDDINSESDIPDGSVIEVLIDGGNQFQAGQSFSADAKIIVRYHRIPKIQFPFASGEVKNTAYIDVAKTLAEAGFSNVSTDEIYDLDPDLFTGEFETEMTFNGGTVAEAGLEIPFDAEIAIVGHYPYEKYNVSVTIDFEKNWIFSKYGVDFQLGEEEPVSMNHGEGGTFDYRLTEGSYSLKFTSEDDPDIFSQITLDVTCDTAVTYDIQCHSDNIELTEGSISYEGKPDVTEIRMAYSSDYYLRKDYSQCIDTLEKMGFTNVNAVSVHDALWGQTPAGCVTSVSVAGHDMFAHGDLFDADAEVTIKYHIPEVAFEQTDVTVTEGDTFEIPLTVSDRDYPKDVSIKIKNETIVVCLEKDSYLAKTPGDTIVEVYYLDICLARCNVTVEKKIIPISNIIVSETEMTVAVGSVFEVEYEIEPADANYTDTTITLSNALLEQTDSGTYYSTEAGDTEIIIMQDERTLAILTVHAIDVPIEEIIIGEEPWSLGAGRTGALAFTLQPENATNRGLQVQSSDPEIAEVSLDERGDHTVSVAGIAPGNATITIQTSDGVAIQKEIVITEILPEKMEIEADTQTPLIGSSGILKVKFTPEDVTSSTVKWNSSDPKVIKLTKDGGYQALSIGKAVITASHASGITQTFEMEVLPVEVEGMMLTSNWKDDKPFYKNDSMTLRVDYYPENATDKKVTWSSSDETVATVSEKGVVKAVSDGTAVISAVSANGVDAVYQVTVDIKPQKFAVSATISMLSNDSVGNRWSKGIEFNDEAIRPGATVSIMPGEKFSAGGWAEDGDSYPDFGGYYEDLTLTKEMCTSGFTIEGDFYVSENGGRYRGNTAEWHLKMTFKPVK